MKRTFTEEERICVFNLWKQGAGFSDIGRVINAKPGSVFTILREHGGIQPEKRKGVLGFFRPKTTLIAAGHAHRGLPEGITFSGHR